jgi:hypothetical protein
VHIHAPEPKLPAKQDDLVLLIIRIRLHLLCRVIHNAYPPKALSFSFWFHLQIMKFGNLALVAATFLALSPTASSEFVPYTTSVDIYLDPNSVSPAHRGTGTSMAQDTRWDLSSAVNRGDCTQHRRDFVFTCGWYNDADTNNSPAWICSASNNTPGWPKNPGRSPYTLPTKADWYTFRHSFNDVSGVLSVDLEILDSGGMVLTTWTLLDASDIVIPTVGDGTSGVGGNRYGWFVNVGCIGACSSVDSNFKLPIDNTKKCNIYGCRDFVQDFEENDDGWFDYNSMINRVATGTSDVASSSGSFHAEVLPAKGGPFTRWDGYCTAVIPRTHICI